MNKYSDESFCIWLSKKHFLIYANYNTLFYKEIKQDEYNDESFCLWLSLNHPLVFGEYKGLFFMDVHNEKP